jgi:transposase-like protein
MLTLDGNTTWHEAVGRLQKEGTLPAERTVRTNKYFNNGIVQDHRQVKQRVRPGPGYKRFNDAAVTLAGIELVHQSKKPHFDLATLCTAHTRTPQVWQAMLAA